MTDVPVAVLTNGSLLWQQEARAEVALADVVLPSLDAPDPERFEFINRPHPEITFEQLMDGLTAFRREFTGQCWLEVMLLGGYTSLPAQVRQLADLARRIRPDKVQLNTAVRPPAEEYALAVPSNRLAKLARMFEPPAEVIAAKRPRQASSESAASIEAILALLQRRPCAAEDLARGLGMNPGEAVKCLAELESRGQIEGVRHGSQVYYRPAGATQSPGTRARRRKMQRTAGPRVLP
jgi:wyosine [tRNA(Phe)-imidazoG37] synthetase (radical SAM superfamily)